MALAQGTDILLLDEPTTYLDLAHSMEVLDLVDQLHEEMGRTVVMVLHDLNLAVRYSDHLIVMRDGAVVASGVPPKEIISAELLLDVFGLEAAVIDDPVSDRPLIVPIGTRHVFGAVGGPAKLRDDRESATQNRPNKFESLTDRHGRQVRPSDRVPDARQRGWIGEGHVHRHVPSWNFDLKANSERNP